MLLNDQFQISKKCKQSTEDKHCSCARSVSAISVCENDKNFHDFDIPFKYRNTSHCSHETHASHNEQTNTQPDIIPCACNQTQISGKEIQDTGYSESCAHPYIVNTFVNQHNNVLVNSSSRFWIPKTKDLSQPVTDCTVHMDYNLKHAKCGRNSRLEHYSEDESVYDV